MLFTNYYLSSGHFTTLFSGLSKAGQAVRNTKKNVWP